MDSDPLKESSMRDSCIRSERGRTLLRHENLVGPWMNRSIVNAVAPFEYGLAC